MKARILATESEKRKGVTGRESLDPDEVFVFLGIYPNQGFHMHKVPFPVTIAFIDRDYGILDIKEMEPESGTAYAPEGTILAIEASKEYFDSKKLKVGDFVKEVHNLLSISEI
jgi:uncharacterized membrane protein (UPF0127 family)